jgi:hypothetical protein
MSVTQAYYEATLRAVTPSIAAWLDELVSECGEDAVVEAIRAEAGRGDHRKLIGRVRERLAVKRVSQRQTIRILSASEILAVIRGEMPEPPRPYGYDAASLSAAEYDEVLRWRANR